MPAQIFRTIENTLSYPVQHNTTVLTQPIQAGHTLNRAINQQAAVQSRPIQHNFGHVASPITQNIVVSPSAQHPLPLQNKGNIIHYASPQHAVYAQNINPAITLPYGQTGVVQSPPPQQHVPAITPGTFLTAFLKFKLIIMYL